MKMISNSLSISFAAVGILMAFQAASLPTLAQGHKESASTNRPRDIPTATTVSKQRRKRPENSTFQPADFHALSSNSIISAEATQTSQVNRQITPRRGLLTNAFVGAHALRNSVCCSSTATVFGGRLASRANLLTHTTQLARSHKTVRFFSGRSVIQVGKSGPNHDWQGGESVIGHWTTNPVGQSWAVPDYVVDPQGVRILSWSW